MKYIIGSKLKQARKEHGFSIEDIVYFLQTKEIDVSPKTVYGWENDFSYPSVYIFLLLCEKYEITNITETFLN